MNDNQNHRVREGWTSSRVIAPPGGGGSLMLGMAPPAKENTQPQKEPEKIEEQPKSKVETTTPPVIQPPHPTPTPASTPVAPAPTTILPGLGAPSVPISANAFASGANMNGAQVMTGRPTSRVRHPGGAGGPDSGWTLG